MQMPRQAKDAMTWAQVLLLAAGCATASARSQENPTVETIKAPEASTGSTSSPSPSDIPLLASATSTPDQNSQRPHIIFILADDLGFNDVAFRGSDQVPTPNIDALAYGGLVLDKYYVTPICTPTRSALFTGKYPIHTGMQHRVLYAAEPRGLPLSETLLPQYLRRLGYATHLVGKWHLGFFKREYTPTFRGFDSHVGLWTGHHDYYDHSAVEPPHWGLDMRRGMDPAWDLHGIYTTEVLSKESERIILRHNASRPLFLMVSHAAVHSSNPYSPLPAPDDTVARFNHITDYNRRRFAAMLSELDKSVGRVVAALQRNGLLENSIIVFSTDNGGPAAGFNRNAASNYPLRGVKNTLWEGGIRGAGVMWAPHIHNPGRLATQLLHVTDWLPTLYHAAGGNPRTLKGELDGIDAWEALTLDGPSSRQTVLHNIDDIFETASVTHGVWKLIQGSTYGDDWNGWYGPSGRGRGERPYDLGQVLGSMTARAFRKLGRPLTPSAARSMRAAATVNCPTPTTTPSSSYSAHPLANTAPAAEGEELMTDSYGADCVPQQKPCLFNIEEDPCEMNNLASRFPEVLKRMQHLLRDVNATAVPPSNLPMDSRADPRFWDHTWTNFGDFIDNANSVATVTTPSRLLVLVSIQSAIILLSALSDFNIL